MSGLEVSLPGIQFSQEPLRKIAIAGETGSGKSSLLKMIGGLKQVDTGEVLFEGMRVKGPLERLIPGQPGIAYLSQHFELPNNYWLMDILSYENKLSDEEAEEIYAIGRIGHLLGRKTNQLSGGERQRIALTRALISRPRLLLLDEPFSNLDMIHKMVLKDVIRDIGERLGISCILVSHDPQDSLSWADEIMVLKDGAVVQHGSPQDIYLRPQSGYVAGLFGPYNLVAERGQDKMRFVRPEEINIAEDGNLHAVVEDRSFWGGHYQLRLRMGDLVIIARAAHGNYTQGQELYFSLPADRVWYI